MGREVRRVPSDWVHPKNDGRYIGLHEGYIAAKEKWSHERTIWKSGVFPEYATASDKKLTYVEWAGERPDKADYMPTWGDVETTHLMMYETCTEGTPISPAFKTPEELATWLTDNLASAFGDTTASYESWLRVAGGGYACSAVVKDGVIYSGVEGFIK